MMKNVLKIGAIGLLLAAGVGVGPQRRAMADSMPHLESYAHFEQNATDEDFEVVFKVTGVDVGLVKLTVVDPDGRTAIDFKAPDASTLGIRTFVLESPEPGNLESLKSAYPEGVYTFTAVTADGKTLHSKSNLHHKLPPAVSVLGPKHESEDVATRDVEITWTPVENLAFYVIELEQEEMNAMITVKLPAPASSFFVPNGFLLPDTEYKLGIGTESEDGNLSVVETDFTTAEED